MRSFSGYVDINENISEIILEAILSSNIQSITDLNINENPSWFKHPDTQEDRSGSVDLLVELISKQPGLQHLNLGVNFFSSQAT